MTKPCDQCPFIRGGIKLHPDRLRELARGAATDDRFSFYCHHTVDYDTDDDDDGEGVITSNSQLCAGAMAFTLKTLGHQNQIMRIMSRIGGIDQVEDDDRVYGGVKEMVREGSI